ncbi:MAG TPA: Ig-like domain-containing protein [Candidatus Deferrimicrobium sp.]|nr:Ig-like domain-containing protein [Candidatus Deferrimicrobium sp.]
MQKKRLLIVILLAAVITIGILVPVLLLTGKPAADKIPPTIQILSPTNTSYTSQQIDVNFTTSDSDVHTIWYRIHDDTAGTWVDLTNLTWTFLIQRTLTQDAVYTLYVWANDTAGNTATVLSVSFTIDALAPTITILSPTNTTYTSQTTQITIDLESLDLNVDALWYRVYNETDGAWVDPNNITWTSSCQKMLGKGGVYTLYAWANDSLGRISSVKTTTFTMYHEIIYSGNHAFASDFTIETYQKVIFQNGEFSFSSGNLNNYGILNMYNITWTSLLTMNGNSECIGTNITFNEITFFHGNLVVSLNDIIFLNAIALYDTTFITLTDVFFTATIYTYDSAKLAVFYASNAGFISVGSSMVNFSDSTLGGASIDDYSVVTLNNFTIPSIDLLDNASLTLINTTINLLYEYLSFETGNWIIDANLISGTGTYTEPKITAIDSTINYLYPELDIKGSTNLFINNSVYSFLRNYEYSKITLENTSFLNIYLYENSNATIYNSTISYLYLQTNGSIYLEEMSIYTIYHGFVFYQGNISGYNETFIGATSWIFPKVTLGPNVFYTYYYYDYDIRNQVNFTLSNTTNAHYLYAMNSANVTLVFFDSPNAFIFNYEDANVTIYYSKIYILTSYHTGNVTLVNSTCVQLTLYQSSFASVIVNSHIETLTLHDSSSYYKSPDSVIDSIIPP